ncbi:hypothetical protein IWT25_02391 [Secundilactobacillus pentosiphilus]|uniref:XkdX family protein n=1 Tax=Secundilactobacillus pentosiphilus TaxID=1714682 RepID=A0A1Z5IZ39_9LACO|nr:XkdX family protein [Secundilactobacillus pentosiphilus]GAX07043.1 hypothetical protein IWT25_02391 [Secundilactobacillus pentosiphilus]
MVQIYKWAYQDWKTIDEDGLKQLVGLPQGITADDYKTITGDDYQATSTASPTA